MKTAPGDPYRIINLVFVLIISGIFLYSWYYGFPGKVHPVPSVSGMLTGRSSISTGLSRSFSSITHFRFDEAKSYNPYGVRIFIFFLAQLFMRIAGLFLAERSFRTTLIAADAVISCILFLFLFWPFLKFLISAFIR